MSVWIDDRFDTLGVAVDQRTKPGRDRSSGRAVGVRNPPKGVAVTVGDDQGGAGYCRGSANLRGFQMRLQPIGIECRHQHPGLVVRAEALQVYNYWAGTGRSGRPPMPGVRPTGSSWRGGRASRGSGRRKTPAERHPRRRPATCRPMRTMPGSDIAAGCGVARSAVPRNKVHQRSASTETVRQGRQAGEHCRERWLCRRSPAPPDAARRRRVAHAAPRYRLICE